MDNKKLFVVTGAGRDGAAMLGARLSHEPEIRWIGNFTRLSNWDKADTISVGALLDKIMGEFKEPIIGFRLLADEARAGRWSCLRAELQKRGVMAINMKRRDTLKQLCSCQFEKRRFPQRQIPHSYIDFSSKLELIKGLARLDGLYRKEEEEWAMARRILLEYEVIMSNSSKAALAWALLGLTPPEKIKWTTRRTDTRKASTIIRNYEQVRGWLRGTRWESLVRRA
jgi:hypothetical protein